MKDDTCMIFGTVHDVLPTSESTSSCLLPNRVMTTRMNKVDVANRRKGTLMVQDTRV